MKRGPRLFYLLSAVFAVVFIVLIITKTDFITYGFLGASIGALIRGFMEESKKAKLEKEINKN